MLKPDLTIRPFDFTQCIMYLKYFADAWNAYFIFKMLLSSNSSEVHDWSIISSCIIFVSKAKELSAEMSLEIAYIYIASQLFILSSASPGKHNTRKFRWRTSVMRENIAFTRMFRSCFISPDIISGDLMPDTLLISLYYDFSIARYNEVAARHMTRIEHAKAK